MTFLSEAGDLPLMEVTKGRLTGPQDFDLTVSEYTKGDMASLVFDGSDRPTEKTFTVTNLISGGRYVFKVAAINVVGDGVLSGFDSAIARSGASAEQTTASGGALRRGLAGSIQEVQQISFASSDCTNDQLILSFRADDQTGNLCGASAKDFETALNAIPGVGIVHACKQGRASNPRWIIWIHLVYNFFVSSR